jgi:redox-sensitive bicupin YhaK (pirin superfamily)
MTAGSGLIHSEVSSAKFKETGGPLEILQLWLNLPAKHKMTAPHYLGLQAEDIPAVNVDIGSVTVHLVAGEWDDTKAPVQALSGVQLSWITFQPGGKLNTSIPSENNIFLYVVRGQLAVQGLPVEARQLVEFNHDSDELEIEATTDSLLLFGHGASANEPVVAYGPFVMNTEDEIQQAYQDYQAGKFGVWRD